MIKKTISLVLLLMLFSCNKEIEVVYCSNFFLFNNTGRLIEMRNGSKYSEIVRNGTKTWLYTTELSNDYEKVSLERIIDEDEIRFKNVTIYDVLQSECVLLKKWSYEDRDKEGKQLYRLSDSELIVGNESLPSCVKISYNYIFVINPEDVGL